MNSFQGTRDNGAGVRRSLPLASETVVILPHRTDALIRGLDLVLEHHGASDLVRGELSNQLHAHLDTSLDETVWLKRSKYALTYPLSKYLKNESPPAPDVAFRPSGALRAWMKPRLIAFNRRNTHLWYSWLQAKRSTLPASDEIVDAAYEKHFATLTKVDPGLDSTIDEIFEDPTFIRLLETVRNSFSKNLEGGHLFEELAASKSACFERTRGKGGQHGELLQLAGLGDGLNGSELYAMRWDPVVFGKQRRWSVVTEIRCAVGRESWKTLVGHAQAWNRFQPTKCTIQAVLEPMKVRIISKGESLPYYTCRPLQKALHSAMRVLPPFRLIGRPFSPTDMLDLSERASLTDSWFSVDYSAATDGLSWKYSGRIFRFLCGNLPRPQYDLAMAVLGPHALHYPVRGGREVVFRGIQQNGQLMGSILSFPILCLANAGVYLAVTRDDQDGWSDEDRLRHVLINGDDMVYAADPSLWKRHVRTAAEVGLEMSVGKAYRHSTYANVNSTSVLLDLSKRGSTPWQINYLNSGLFYGQHKVQERVGKEMEVTEAVFSSRCGDDELGALYAAAHLGQDPAKGLVSNLNTLLDGCLPAKQTPILRKFLALHAEELRKECMMVETVRGHTCLRTRNIFLPLSVGGMGVLPPCGYKPEIKLESRRIGSACLNQSSAPVTFGRPLPGWDLEKIEPTKPVPWAKVDNDVELFALTVHSSMYLGKAKLRAGLYRYGPNSVGVAA